MSIGKINHFFEKLLKCDKLNDDAGVELCLKILKILVKNTTCSFGSLVSRGKLFSMNFMQEKNIMPLSDQTSAPIF